jgi:hypothetical protein
MNNTTLTIIAATACFTLSGIMLAIAVMILTKKKNQGKCTPSEEALKQELKMYKEEATLIYMMGVEDGKRLARKSNEV